MFPTGPSLERHPVWRCPVKRKVILNLAGAVLASAVIFSSETGIAQEGAAAPASTPAFGSGRRNFAPLVGENAKLVNLALVATPSTSFVSGDQTILAINDGANP